MNIGVTLDDAGPDADVEEDLREGRITQAQFDELAAASRRRTWTGDRAKAREFTLTVRLIGGVIVRVGEESFFEPSDWDSSFPFTRVLRLASDKANLNSIADFDGPLPAGERQTCLGGKTKEREIHMRVVSGGKVAASLKGDLKQYLCEPGEVDLTKPLENHHELPKLVVEVRDEYGGFVAGAPGDQVRLRWEGADHRVALGTDGNATFDSLTMALSAKDLKAKLTGRDKSVSVLAITIDFVNSKEGTAEGPAAAEGADGSLRGLPPMEYYVAISPSSKPTQLVLSRRGEVLRAEPDGADAEGSCCGTVSLTEAAGSEIDGLALRATNEVDRELGPPFSEGSRLLVDNQELPPECLEAFVASGELPTYQQLRVPSNVADGDRSVTLQLVLGASGTRSQRSASRHTVSLRLKLTPTPGPQRTWRLRQRLGSSTGAAAAAGAAARRPPAFAVGQPLDSLLCAEALDEFGNLCPVDGPASAPLLRLSGSQLAEGADWPRFVLADGSSPTPAHELPLEVDEAPDEPPARRSRVQVRASVAAGAGASAPRGYRPPRGAHLVGAAGLWTLSVVDDGGVLEPEAIEVELQPGPPSSLVLRPASVGAIGAQHGTRVCLDGGAVRLRLLDAAGNAVAADRLDGLRVSGRPIEPADAPPVVAEASGSRFEPTSDGGDWVIERLALRFDRLRERAVRPMKIKQELLFSVRVKKEGGRPIELAAAPVPVEARFAESRLVLDLAATLDPASAWPAAGAEPACVPAGTALPPILVGYVVESGEALPHKTLFADVSGAAAEPPVTCTLTRLAAEPADHQHRPLEHLGEGRFALGGGEVLTGAGEYVLQAVYFERRPEVRAALVGLEDELRFQALRLLRFRVSAGPPARLIRSQRQRFHKQCNNTTHVQVHGGIELRLVDAHGNGAPPPAGLQVKHVLAGWPDGAAPPLELPPPADFDEHGTARLGGVKVKPPPDSLGAADCSLSLGFDLVAWIQPGPPPELPPPLGLTFENTKARTEEQRRAKEAATRRGREISELQEQHDVDLRAKEQATSRYQAERNKHDHVHSAASDSARRLSHVTEKALTLGPGLVEVETLDEVVKDARRNLDGMRSRAFAGARGLSDGEEDVLNRFDADHPGSVIGVVAELFVLSLKGDDPVDDPRCLAAVLADQLGAGTLSMIVVRTVPASRELLRRFEARSDRFPRILALDAVTEWKVQGLPMPARDGPRGPMWVRPAHELLRLRGDLQQLDRATRDAVEKRIIGRIDLASLAVATSKENVFEYQDQVAAARRGRCPGMVALDGFVLSSKGYIGGAKGRVAVSLEELHRKRQRDRGTFPHFGFEPAVDESLRAVEALGRDLDQLRSAQREMRRHLEKRKEVDDSLARRQQESTARFGSALLKETALPPALPGSQASQRTEPYHPPTTRVRTAEQANLSAQAGKRTRHGSTYDLHEI